MSEFDEWFKNRHTKTGLYEEALCGKDDATYIRHEMRKAYLAGQQSQQAKIDELQARIDATEKWIESNKKNIPLSEWHGYTTEEYVDADDLLEILKGNKDEN